MSQTCLIFGASSYISNSLIPWIQNNTNVAIEGTIREEHPIYYNCDTTLSTSVDKIIKEIKPDFAINSVGLSDFYSCEIFPSLALKTNEYSVQNILESISKYSPKTKFLNLGSIKELVDYNSFYALTKRSARGIVEYYRKNKKVWASQPFLGNTTSKFQDSHRFLVPKIIQSARLIKEEKQDSLEVGNIESNINLLHVDSASELLWTCLQSDNPIDFLIRGIDIKISDLINIIFSKFDLDYQKYIKINANLCRPTENVQSIDKIKNILQSDNSIESIINKLI